MVSSKVWSHLLVYLYIYRTWDRLTSHLRLWIRAFCISPNQSTGIKAATRLHSRQKFSFIFFCRAKPLSDEYVNVLFWLRIISDILSYSVLEILMFCNVRNDRVMARATLGCRFYVERFKRERSLRNKTATRLVRTVTMLIILYPVINKAYYVFILFNKIYVFLCFTSNFLLWNSALVEL